MTPQKLFRASDKVKINHWLKNLLVAHAVMAEIPSHLIYKNLEGWCTDVHTCGSPACFGGWVSRIPFFREQGVKQTTGGSPDMGGRGASHVSYFLFGNTNMFDPRSSFFLYMNGRGGEKPLSDRKLILRRIETQIESLTE